jgi:hypothetical protein
VSHRENILDDRKLSRSASSEKIETTSHRIRKYGNGAFFFSSSSYNDLYIIVLERLIFR